MNTQISIDEIEFLEHLSKQPDRVAYIDECGSFGFDFSKEGTSKFYVLTAVIVDSDNIDKLHDDFVDVKRTNGLANTELKSSKVDDNRRQRIMHQLLPLDFRIVVFIADKEKFQKESPLSEFKKTFIKNMNSRMHRMLYQAFPKLKIVMDAFGYSEFQESFKQYVSSQRTQLNIFNEYEFDFSDSRNEDLIQIADFIGGSITKYLLSPGNTVNYIEMLKGKITAMKRFPEQLDPYWGSAQPEDYKYDSSIYTLAVKRAKDFIAEHQNDKADDRKAQVAVLQYLLFYVANISSTQYVYSDELLRHLQPYIERKPTKDFLFRRVIAPLRDSGVILASCVHGYKIPISVEDIITYMNQTTSTVGPMLERMGICRQLIKQGTDNELDIFDDEAFVKYKRYFD